MKIKRELTKISWDWMSSSDKKNLKRSERLQSSQNKKTSWKNFEETKKIKNSEKNKLKDKDLLIDKLSYFEIKRIRLNTFLINKLKRLKEKLLRCLLCKNEDEKKWEMQSKNLEKCKWTRSDLKKNLKERRKRNLLLTGKSETRSFKKQKFLRLKRKEIEIENLLIITNYKMLKNKQN